LPLADPAAGGQDQPDDDPLPRPTFSPAKIR
jgi:hypothetical protein